MKIENVKATLKRRRRARIANPFRGAAFLFCVLVVGVTGVVRLAGRLVVRLAEWWIEPLNPSAEAVTRRRIVVTYRRESTGSVYRLETDGLGLSATNEQLRDFLVGLEFFGVKFLGDTWTLDGIEDVKQDDRRGRIRSDDGSSAIKDADN